jgi:ribonuclease Z
MKIVFFGSAGAVPAADNGNVCFAVQAGAAALLVDASGNPVQSLLRAGLDPRTLDALALTHAHTDHIYALPSLIHCLWLSKRDKLLRILADPSTREKAVRLLEQFDLLKREGLFPLEWSEGRESGLEIAGSLRVELFPVKHSVPASGLRLEGDGATCVYSADTAPSASLTAAAAGCRVLIHEASGDAGREDALNAAGHSSAGQAGEAAARAGAKRLFLCHFDTRFGPAPEELAREARARFAGEVIIPESFRPYDLGPA